MSEESKPAADSPQESYVVVEGKKRASSREVRPEARYDRYYTIVRVHGGDALLTDNWHTNEVLTNARENFEGHTFDMRTLEAWGGVIESETRAFYTAGGRVWVFDLEPASGPKPRQLGARI
jgi:hypothetical protein